MRLLNSICKILSDTYAGVTVHIEEMPVGFVRPCFYVKLVTDPKEIKSNNVYNRHPTFQIIYFGERSETNQVQAELLYEAEDVLERLFLLALAIPVITGNDETEKQRYAKIESFTSDLRIDEGALYCNLTLNFTEEIPKSDEYELVEEVTLDTSVNAEE